MDDTQPGTQLDAINDRGQVIGTTGTRAFLWERGTCTRIRVPGPTDTVFPSAINDRGQVAGSYYGRFPGSRGFVLSAGAYTTVAFPRARDGWQGPTSLLGIDSQGRCVGGYEDKRAFRHGFVWGRGAFTPIAPPVAEGRDVYALGINDAGQVVGCYYDVSARGHGFVLGRGGYATLDYPDPDTNTTARVITGSGRVLGEVESIAPRHGPAAQGWGFLWWQGAFTRITFPGATRTVPTGVNDRGQVVGWYSNGRGPRHGFLFNGAAYTRIDYPGATETELAGVNGRGQVIGMYRRLPAGRHKSSSNPGVEHGFLWTP
ncbi:MAG: hypothetical protein JO250_07875 [Armatimonadetes bacterium]|nr:hypothetical protein [Armatimonadota bacterium]